MGPMIDKNDLDFRKYTTRVVWWIFKVWNFGLDINAILSRVLRPEKVKISKCKVAGEDNRCKLLHIEWFLYGQSGLINLQSLKERVEFQ